MIRKFYLCECVLIRKALVAFNLRYTPEHFMCVCVCVCMLSFSLVESRVDLMNIEMFMQNELKTD
jgi:hypothetical protein